MDKKYRDNACGEVYGESFDTMFYQDHNWDYIRFHYSVWEGVWYKLSQQFYKKVGYQIPTTVETQVWKQNQFLNRICDNISDELENHVRKDMNLFNHY